MIGFFTALEYSFTTQPFSEEVSKVKLAPALPRTSKFKTNPILLSSGKLDTNASAPNNPYSSRSVNRKYTSFFNSSPLESNSIVSNNAPTPAALSDAPCVLGCES